MVSHSAFGDLPVFGELSADAKAALLTELGELAVTGAMPEQRRDYGFFRGDPKPYEYGAHAFGYVGDETDADGLRAMTHAGKIQPDATLADASLMISLGGIRVACYPGSGRRTVLFDFYGRNQAGATTEDLHFNAKYDVTDNDHVGVLNVPIFVGLRPAKLGVGFECATVNVCNHDDEAFLGFLEGDAFKHGLQLAMAAQPAIAVFSATALSITKAIAKRNRNVAVQRFSLGLDFGTKTAAGARLREGTYIAVQIPQRDERVFAWSEWRWDTEQGQLVRADNRNAFLPFNAVTINVSRVPEGEQTATQLAPGAAT